MNPPPSCRRLAQLAGVSVRTLRYYDRIGLLRPAHRTEARYRSYGPAEQLRLQQILFYKELDFPLARIQELLADPDFDPLTALQQQRPVLAARRDRLTHLLRTLDHTIAHLTHHTPMPTPEDLYAGFTPEQAARYRQEARAAYGPATVAASEEHLRGLGQVNFAQLKADAADLTRETLALHAQAADPTGPAVQARIARHYQNIRGFWGPGVPATGTVKEAYRGLGDLYVHDLRYVSAAPADQAAAYAAFLRAAIHHYADTQL